MDSPTQAPVADREDLLHASIPVAAGVLLSAIAASLCKPARWPAVFAGTLYQYAAGYMLVTCAAGALGTWLVWSLLRHRSSISFAWVAIHAAGIWIYILPAALFIRQDSLLILIPVAAASAAAAVCLRYLLAETSPPPPQLRQPPPLFTESLLPTPPWRWSAFAAAIGMQGTAIALFTPHTLVAATLAAIAAYAFKWQGRILKIRSRRNAAMDLVTTGLIALFITFLALLPRPTSHAIGEEALYLIRNSTRRTAPAAASTRQPEEHGAPESGYRGIVLLTLSEKKPKVLVAPAFHPAPTDLASRKTPLVIPFDGPYWYFQQPHTSPGPNAHVARGNPMAVNVHSTNALSMLMEAHQALGSPVDLACCREIQVTIGNRDNRPGSILMAVLLQDSRSPGKPTIALGVKPVVSSDADHFSIKSSPVEETVHFALPQRSKIARFDEMTVVFFPSAERSRIGSQIEIRQFALQPR